MADPACPYCEQHHRPRYLCDPAKATLDALIARGMSFNMPTIEFPDPVQADEIGLGIGPGVVLLRQLVVYGATMPAAGIARPAVIFSGRASDGAELPKWLYAGRDDDMARLSKLVSDMTALAVRSAAEARQR